MALTQDELGEVVRSGLVADIFRMERAYALLKSVEESAVTFNGRSTGNFGDLFGALQGALVTECVLAAARIFDPPSKRYPTRSMRYVLDLLRENKDSLAAIREPHQLKLTLEASNLDDLVPLIAQHGAAFAEGVANRFEALINEPDRLRALDALKTIRDKSLAHNEHVTRVEGPTWIALRDLIDVAKRLAGILGWAYLGTAYEVNGDFVLTRDASRPSRALERLAEKLREGSRAAAA